jgi:hypothetical protein
MLLDNQEKLKKFDNGEEIKQSATKDECTKNEDGIKDEKNNGINSSAESDKLTKEEFICEYNIHWKEKNPNVKIEDADKGFCDVMEGIWAYYQKGHTDNNDF